VSPGEVEVMRRIRNVIRLGRVHAIEAGHLVLDQGMVPVAADTLFIDCTASAVDATLAKARPPQPIFQADRIELQRVRLPQPAFSAALLAYVEAHDDSDKEKNRLCSSVPFPHTMDDCARAIAINMWNQFQWGQDKTLRQWIRESRLDGFGKLMVGINPHDTEKLAIIARLKEQAGAAMANIRKLVAAGH
jgi:hypothetical protein